MDTTAHITIIILILAVGTPNLLVAFATNALTAINPLNASANTVSRFYRRVALSNAIAVALLSLNLATNKSAATYLTCLIALTVLALANIAPFAALISSITGIIRAKRER